MGHPAPGGLIFLKLNFQRESAETRRKITADDCSQEIGVERWFFSFFCARSADLAPRQAKIGLAGDPASSPAAKGGLLYGLPAAAREPQA